MASRTPDEIKASVEANRQELAVSLGKLRGEVVAITDWRRQLAEHKREALIGAAVVGFVVGGGIAGLTGLALRRRRRS